MSWFRWARRAEGPAPMLPAVAAPVAHVVGPGRLSLDAGRIIQADEEGRRQATLLLDGLELLVCHGRVEIDAGCLAALAEAKVAVAFLTADGRRLLARVTPENDPRVVGRVMQHRVLADPDLRARLARPIVAEKIHSQAGAARHYQRQGKAVGREDLDRLADFERRAADTGTLDELLGMEGAAAVIWFDVFGRLLRKPWEFQCRSRRPPADPVNAVLSLGYTLLQHRVTAACQAAGLETAIGPLHAYRAGRQSLACDLMEPLRVPVVDRWVIGLLNQGRVAAADFHAVDGKGIRLTSRAFPKVLADWERQWNESRMSSVVSDRVRAFTGDIRSLAKPFKLLMRELESNGVAELG
jgi:CRISPR-associated protein Cas1